MDVSVGMGLITLAGIAVNNAIVLVDYANRQAKKARCFADALKAAALVRLRPILMTALTTIFALIPTAIGQATGSKIFKSFAITLIGGLISSTAVTFLLIPTILTFLRPGRGAAAK